MSVKLSSLCLAILSEIDSESSTGYKITKKLPKKRGWVASHQQIYRELDKLAGSDMLTSILIPSDDRPDSRIYSITELGIETLKKEKEETEFKAETFRSKSTIMLSINATKYFDSALVTLERKLTELAIAFDCGNTDEYSKLVIKLEMDHIESDINFSLAALKMIEARNSDLA